MALNKILRFNMEFDLFYDTKDYKLFDEEISQGAFSRVYIAENINNHQQYYVKIINAEEEFDGREQMIFIRESLLFQT